MNESSEHNDDAACEGCELTRPRREFLKEIGLAAMGALTEALPAVVMASAGSGPIRPIRSRPPTACRSTR